MASRMPVDVELLMVTLYKARMPAAVSVVAAPDVDSLTSLPMLIVSPVSGAMISNGAPNLGWLWSVEVTLLAEGHAAASNLAAQLYVQTHGLENAVVTNVGTVGVVEDEMMPRRVAVSVQLNNLTQFTGSFQFVILPA